VISMKWTAVIFVALALPLSFWLGRASAPAQESELASVASFRRSLEDPDWLTRSHRFSAFLVGLKPENLPDALEALEPHLPGLLTDEFRMFMLAWSRFDPRGAFEHARAWPPQIRRNAGGAVMYAWGFRNPLEAVRELKNVRNVEMREFWAARMLAGWAHGEFRDSASDYIAKLPKSSARLAFLGTLAWEISKESPEAVMRWAEGVPDNPPRFKQAVFLKAATTLAGIDAALAARWLRDHVDHDYAYDALLVTARSWALSDPRAAMSWLIELPPGKKRAAAVKDGFASWHRHAPNQAERWLRSASPAPAVDSAVRFMVEQARSENPKAARKWAARIAVKP
jgi:hypothetical protein